MCGAGAGANRFEPAALSVIPRETLAPAREACHAHGRHWLDYDSVAFAVLVVGMGAIELLALSI